MSIQTLKLFPGRGFWVYPSTISENQSSQLFQNHLIFIHTNVNYLNLNKLIRLRRLKMAYLKPKPFTIPLPTTLSLLTWLAIRF